jgi:23S rRNA (cytosine1962-C5)-methyltransferase
MSDLRLMLDVVLKPGRERSVKRRHPWVLSGSVAELRGRLAAPGALARVLSADREVLGYGDFSPASNIRVRVLSFGPDEPGKEIVAERVVRALALRERDALIGETDAVRLVNAEGDGLPGLVVDRYADVVVVKLSSAGMASRREELASTLRSATGAAAGYERADATAARREGLAVVKGALWGASPPGSVPIAERNRRFAVDVVGGQKTGFYIDQRDARDLVARLARGRRVLDLFSYTGGFGVAAALGGASEVTLVESSAAALERARTHLYVNAPTCPADLRAADAFGFLRGADSGDAYDLLVVDPPPLARRRGDVTRATRAYKDLLLHAFRRAAPGARILAFACSHHVGPDLFRKVAFGAALDAGRSPSVLRELGAPSDHPVSIDHPEGRYLSGLLLGVDRD